MGFAYPGLLIWASFLALAAALYLFRPRPRKLLVTTLPFFKALALEHQEAAWLRRLKRLLSFLLSAFVLAAGAAALARPYLAPPAGEWQTVVLLLDRSASMAAADDSGKTRLAQAKQSLRHRLSGLPSGTGVMVMAYDQRAEILLPRSLDRREAERALESVEARPLEGDPASALRLATRLAKASPPAAIWHATDFSTLTGEEGVTGEAVPAAMDQDNVDETATTSAGAPHIETMNVALPQPINAGITAFALRELPLEHGRYEAFIEARACAPKPLEATLEIRLDGNLAQTRNFTLQPEGRERLLIPIEAGSGKSMAASIKAEGDCLEWDNTAYALVPEAKALRAVWFHEQPNAFLALALASLADAALDISEASPSAWPPKEMPDLLILDHWLPEAWPEKTPVVLLEPSRSCGPVKVAPLAGKALEAGAPRVLDEMHPLLYGVASRKLSLAQGAVLEAPEALAPLWTGPAGPLLLAGELRGQRIVAMNFAIDRSERLPLMASYPMLLANAIAWATKPAAGEESANHHTGELLKLDGKSITWLTPVPGQEAKKHSAPLESCWARLDSIGLWETDAKRRGAASLLSAKETQLPSFKETPEQKAVLAGGWLGGELAEPLLWGILAALLLESWLFHRKAVY